MDNLPSPSAALDDAGVVSAAAGDFAVAVAVDGRDPPEDWVDDDEDGDVADVGNGGPSSVPRDGDAAAAVSDRGGGPPSGIENYPHGGDDAPVPPSQIAAAIKGDEEDGPGEKKPRNPLEMIEEGCSDVDELDPIFSRSPHEIMLEGFLPADPRPAETRDQRLRREVREMRDNAIAEDGLAVATAVELVYAAFIELYDPDSKPPLHKNRRFRVCTCLAFMVVIAVAAVFSVYVTKSAMGTTVEEMEKLWDGDPSTSPTEAPTTNREASGIREQIEAGVLQRGVNFTGMDPRDPRYMALEWILHADALQLDSDDKNLYQRYVLALLAFSLDSLAWYYCGNHRVVGNETENFANEDCASQKRTGQIEEHKVWLSSTEECDWFGVICSSDEVVRGVELMGNNLIGQIPPEISQLRFLQYLALNGNCLHGTVPPEFGDMPNLLSLELHGNGLSGALPSEIFNASKLQLLNVAMQYGWINKCVRSDGLVANTMFQNADPYEGTINNGLTGHVLGHSVSRWRSMKGLHLFDNSFTGWMDNEVGNLKYLVFLRVANNMLYGWLPGSLGNLKKLRELYLSRNGFTHDIPWSVGGMEDLEDLRINENPMNGTIPDELYRLKKLKYVWIQDTLRCDGGGAECIVDAETGIGGSISKEIGNLRKLSQVLVNNNPLGGSLPTEIGRCENLAVLHIHKTNIGGSSPRELCALRDKNLNNEQDMGVFYADCRPNNKTQNPFFACDCCSDCCDHTTKVCLADD